jgi:hypothetical protein
MIVVIFEFDLMYIYTFNWKPSQRTTAHAVGTLDTLDKRNTDVPMILLIPVMLLAPVILRARMSMPVDLVDPLTMPRRGAKMCSDSFSAVPQTISRLQQLLHTNGE